MLSQVDIKLLRVEGATETVSIRAVTLFAFGISARVLCVPMPASNAGARGVLPLCAASPNAILAAKLIAPVTPRRGLEKVFIFKCVSSLYTITRQNLPKSAVVAKF